MACFTDSKKRDWIVELTVASGKRVRARLGVDLLSDTLGEILERAFSDAAFLVDVLFVLCEAQAIERQVTDEDFGSAMSGAALRGGVQALLEAVTVFTPNPALRDGVGRLKEAIPFLEQQIAKHARADLDALEKEIREKAISGELFRSSQGSSESTRAP